MSNSYQLRIPSVGEGVHYVTVVKLLKNIGDWVDEDSDVFEIETDKSVMAVSTPQSGYISSINLAEGQIANTGEIAIEIHSNHNSIDIPKNSINNFGQKRKKDISNKNQVYVFPDQQKILAQALKKSSEIIIQASIETVFEWKHLTDLKVQVRKKGAFVPSSLEIIVWSTTQAMFKFEKFRAKCTPDMSIEISNAAHVGIAVSLENDVLVTPSICIDREKTFPETAEDVRQKINQDVPTSDYNSVAISDLSALGVRSAQPVVVYPAVATLFVGSPYYETNHKGALEKVSKLVLAFDHRVINGAYASMFLKEIKRNFLSLKF